MTRAEWHFELSALKEEFADWAARGRDPNRLEELRKKSAELVMTAPERDP